MSEIANLVGIYGAIDRAVQDDPERREAVSRLLPEYRDPSLRWFEGFDAWAREREGTEESPVPELRVALRELGADEPQGRMRARRLFALAAAVRAFPELTEDPAIGDLSVASVAPLTADGESPEELLRLLADDDLLPARGESSEALDEWWRRVRDSGLVAYSELIGSRPCSGGLVMAPLPGGTGLAARLLTQCEADIDFDHAKLVLVPENWLTCGEIWCEMRRVGPLQNGVYLYHEVVSLDCGPPPSPVRIEADLNFKIRDVAPGVAGTDYWLPDRIAQADVLVDEGALVVEELSPGRVKFTTSKWIKFNGPCDGIGLASMMCRLGWAEHAEDLLECAASGKKPSTPFPAHHEAARPARSRAGRPRSGSPRSGSPRSGSTPPAGARPDIGSVSKATDQWEGAMKQCIESWADAVRKSLKRIEDEEPITANAIVQDMAKLWVYTVREGARMMTLSIDSARATARTTDNDTSGS